MLALEGVSTRYGPIPILRGVSLRLDRGEVVCLLGPNGAGKTTLIKTILGLIRPFEGEISFEGKRIDGWKTHHVVGLGIAVVPEGRRIFPKMTVRENLRMGAFQEDPSDLDDRLEAIFGLFPRLRERAAQLAGTLSGGEQAMLAVGRALMRRPKLLLLDEPSLGLAPLMVQHIFDTIRQIRDQGTTIFLVEQNAHKTLALASRGYVIQKGEVILQGTAAELRQSKIIQHAYLMA